MHIADFFIFQATSVILAKRAAADSDVDGDELTKLRLKVAIAHPKIPDCNETDELEHSGSMIRVQSLRDLASKFEKMGSPGLIAAPFKGNFQFILVKLNFNGKIKTYYLV